MSSHTADSIGEALPTATDATAHGHALLHEENNTDHASPIPVAVDLFLAFSEEAFEGHVLALVPKSSPLSLVEAVRSLFHQSFETTSRLHILAEYREVAGHLAKVRRKLDHLPTIQYRQADCVDLFAVRQAESWVSDRLEWAWPDEDWAHDIVSFVAVTSPGRAIQLQVSEFQRLRFGTSTFGQVRALVVSPGPTLTIRPDQARVAGLLATEANTVCVVPNLHTVRNNTPVCLPAGGIEIQRPLQGIGFQGGQPDTWANRIRWVRFL